MTTHQRGNQCRPVMLGPPPDNHHSLIACSNCYKHRYAGVVVISTQTQPMQGYLSHSKHSLAFRVLVCNPVREFHSVSQRREIREFNWEPYNVSSVPTIICGLTYGDAGNCEVFIVPVPTHPTHVRTAGV